MSDRPIRRLPQCNECQNNARSAYLLCALHPFGVSEELEECPDYTLDPNCLEEDGEWEVEGFGTYNGDLIASPVERLTKAQRLELLLWHPLFTGLCPECRRPFAVDGNRVHWDCEQCGWMDDTI